METDPEDTPSGGIRTREAGEGWGVTMLPGEGGFSYMRRACAECPWRSDLPAGRFPAEAFRLSACTSYDASLHLFACHMAGRDGLSACAGFLASNSGNNLAVRLAAAKGEYEPKEEREGEAPLFGSYREMAEANGVAPDDPALARSRADWE